MEVLRLNCNPEPLKMACPNRGGYEGSVTAPLYYHRYLKDMLKRFSKIDAAEKIILKQRKTPCDWLNLNRS
jgi:hypothetical protein